MEKKEHKLRVVMFPWLAHGHTAPMFELAKKLSQRNFYIYLCTTPINLSSFKQQLSENPIPNLELVDFHLPSTPELPPHYHTTKLLPPHLLGKLRDACDLSRPSFTTLLKQYKPDLLIYDLMQAWTHSEASSKNIPAVGFVPCAAAATSYMIHMGAKPGVQFPYSNIYLHQHEIKKIAQLFQGDHRNSVGLDPSLSIILIRSFREIEAKYLDYFSVVIGKEILPIGHIVREPEGGVGDGDGDGDDKKSQSPIIDWLDNKDESSVVLVSFGSEYFMTKEEIEEMAYGLELSKANFIWCIRFLEADGEKKKLDEVLPLGFLKRVGDRGMVLEGWVPQVQILKHPSVGGFVCHSGWGTMLESLMYGVPIVSMPMQIDNFMNSRLLVELGVGKEVKRDGWKVSRGDLADAINEVVIAKEGEEVRKKAKELSELMRNKGDEEIDVIEKKLLNLCGKT